MGDNYFSYARLPLNQPEWFFSFGFLDMKGKDLSLSQNDRLESDRSLSNKTIIILILEGDRPAGKYQGGKHDS